MFDYDNEAVEFSKKALLWWADKTDGDFPTNDKDLKSILVNYDRYLGNNKKKMFVCDFRTKRAKNMLIVARALCDEYKEHSFTCCICHKKRYGWGNNPYPLCDASDYESRCCDECNNNYVIPERLAMFYSKKGDNNGEK